MVLVSVALTKSTLINTDLQLDNFILPYNPKTEKSVRKIVRNFIKRHKEDKLLVFADKRSDKLGNLIILREECNKAGIELSISLYCKNTNPEDEEYGSYFFREVDLDLSEEMQGMVIW